MVYVPIGIPFSGKSTWAATVNAVVVNPDSIRKELTGSISDQSRNAEVFDLAYSRLVDCIDAGKDVIFDGTNINPKTRDKIFELVGDKTDVIYVVFPTDIRVAFDRKNNDEERIAKGERSDVPDHVIKQFFDRFESEFGSIVSDSRPKTIQIMS